MNPLHLLCRQRNLKKKLENSRPRLYRVAYAWSHDAALADDLVQESLARALKNLVQLRNEEALDNWLIGILANCWRDYLRRQRASVNIDDCVLTDDDTPERQHARQRLSEVIRTAVARLPMGQRQVVTLVDLEGLAYAEVAEVLQIPIGTVMSRLCRARKLLSEQLLEMRLQSMMEEPPSIRRVI